MQVQFMLISYYIIELIYIYLYRGICKGIDGLSTMEGIDGRLLTNKSYQREKKEYE